jgi:hypothetical protein
MSEEEQNSDFKNAPIKVRRGKISLTFLGLV